jgi:hypothetical protein
MAKVVKTLELPQWKKVNNVSALSIFTSRTSGKKYATNKETGDFIGMLSEDFDNTKPVVVFLMADDESGETWNFIANGEPRKEEFAL